MANHRPLFYKIYKEHYLHLMYCIPCGEIVPHTGGLQQIIMYLCIYIKSKWYTSQWDINKYLLIIFLAPWGCHAQENIAVM